MRTLLEIKNADVYGAAEARALVASLHEEFRRNPAAFHAIGLADIQVDPAADARSRVRLRQRGTGDHEAGLGRLVSLADALHTTGDLRIILEKDGERAVLAAMAAYVSSNDDRPPARSHQLARQTRESAHLIAALAPRAGEYCRASLRRIRDIYALSALLPGRDRPLLDLVMAVLLEASHRVDDYYDNDAKWQTYGYADADAAIAEGLAVVDQLLAGAEYKAEAMARAEALLVYLNLWVGADSRASSLDLSDATQRILECNADLYRRFFEIYSLAMDADEGLRPLFESFGALVWVLDDWRDVEADALNDHFNVFRVYRMDVPAQVSHLEASFGSLLALTSTTLDPMQREELLSSAGTTRIMRRYLDILA